MRPKLVGFGSIHDGHGLEIFNRIICRTYGSEQSWQRIRSSTAWDKVNCLKNGVAASFEIAGDSDSTCLINAAITGNLSKIELL